MEVVDRGPRVNGLNGAHGVSPAASGVTSAGIPALADGEAGAFADRGPDAEPGWLARGFAGCDAWGFVGCLGLPGALRTIPQRLPRGLPGGHPRLATGGRWVGVALVVGGVDVVVLVGPGGARIGGTAGVVGAVSVVPGDVAVFVCVVDVPVVVVEVSVEVVDVVVSVEVVDVVVSVDVVDDVVSVDVVDDVGVVVPVEVVDVVVSVDVMPPASGAKVTALTMAAANASAVTVAASHRVRQRQPRPPGSFTPRPNRLPRRPSPRTQERVPVIFRDPGPRWSGRGSPGLRPRLEH